MLQSFPKLHGSGKSAKSKSKRNCKKKRRIVKVFIVRLSRPLADLPIIGQLHATRISFAIVDVVDMCETHTKRCHAVAKDTQFGVEFLSNTKLLVIFSFSGISPYEYLAECRLNIKRSTASPSVGNEGEVAKTHEPPLVWSSVSMTNFSSVTSVFLYVIEASFSQLKWPTQRKQACRNMKHCI